MERKKFKEYLMPINQMGGIQINAPNLVDISPFNTHDDYKDYIQRLTGFSEKINCKLWFSVKKIVRFLHFSKNPGKSYFFPSTQLFFPDSLKCVKKYCFFPAY